MKNMGLVDLVDALRAELQQLQEQSTAKMFSLKAVEIELKFVVENTGEAGGRAKFLVFDAELKGSHAHETVHTIKLSLELATEQDKALTPAQQKVASRMIIGERKPRSRIGRA